MVMTLLLLAVWLLFNAGLALAVALRPRPRWLTRRRTR
jgi:hypothetical protein